MNNVSLKIVDPLQWIFGRLSRLLRLSFLWRLGPASTAETRRPRHREGEKGYIYTYIGSLWSEILVPPVPLWPLCWFSSSVLLFWPGWRLEGPDPSYYMAPQIVDFWGAGPWTQRPGQTPVVSLEAWMEVLAFLFWFGWRGGGAPCASLTPLLVLLLCPPLLARVAAGGPRLFLLYGASNCWFLGRRPLNPKTPTNASSFFGALDGSLGFSLLVWVAGRWCPLCLFNPSIGSPPVLLFWPGWRLKGPDPSYYMAPQIVDFWGAGPWTQRPRQTPVVSWRPGWKSWLFSFGLFGWRGGGAPCASLTPLLVLLLCAPLLARVNPPTYKDLPGWRLESPDPPLYPADRPGHKVLRKMCLGPPPLEKRARVKTSAAENPSDRPKKPH